jgi:hypothetical protein
MQEFIEAYAACALWSSIDDNGDPFDDKYSIDDIAPGAMDQMKRDCEDFVHHCGDLILQSDMSMSQAGYDFWLTRNRHGTGFWDRGLGDIGHTLTQVAQGYGEVYIYVGDDDMIYTL